MDFTITDRKSIQVKRKSLIQERQKMEEQKMELEALRKDMVAAMKAKDKVTKEAVSALIAAVKKAAIDEGCRDDIKGELVDKVILKELKTAKEQIDTCPAERTKKSIRQDMTSLRNTLRSRWMKQRSRLISRRNLQMFWQQEIKARS